MAGRLTNIRVNSIHTHSFVVSHPSVLIVKSLIGVPQQLREPRQTVSHVVTRKSMSCLTSSSITVPFLPEYISSLGHENKPAMQTESKSWRENVIGPQRQGHEKVPSFEAIFIANPTLETNLRNMLGFLDHRSMHVSF